MAVAPACASVARRTPAARVQRSFATSVFNVKVGVENITRAGVTEKSLEQTLFVVGLNEGKFFGPDGSEEALKLVEQVAEHDPEYELLFSLTEKELTALQEDHDIGINRRLTPSRDLEGEKLGEFVPVMQAGMADNRPRRALGRALRTSHARVAWQLWQRPREAVQIYWMFWRRKEYKDGAKYKFALKHLPVASHYYFVERAELVAVRSVEHLLINHVQGKGGTTVLTVSNDIYDLVAERLRLILDEDVADKFGSMDFSRTLKERAMELTRDMVDMTPVLIFVYIGIPLLIGHQIYLASQYYYHKYQGRLGEGTGFKLDPVFDRD
eukprot:gnl/TRDRNA2_/TRDRNA2_182622_c0_seq1.p1 gnl/TRDRNA2_/TRDRNA2_182622_c0~~gnl/TRDRNA2_/TRDRNA2_182622_c0_seq1.p1  ORF type:complete len:349 (+),score=57.39 gnl/TRDRNA2_/TRDRNA2_182622_c0_seq1:73-1047(+)